MTGSAERCVCVCVFTLLQLVFEALHSQEPRGYVVGWIIAISLLVGILIFLLLAVLLWKVPLYTTHVPGSTSMLVLEKIFEVAVGFRGLNNILISLAFLSDFRSTVGLDLGLAGVHQTFNMFRYLTTHTFWEITLFHEFLSLCKGRNRSRPHTVKQRL